MSCISRGHRHDRRQIDGRWYWACRDCPDRMIAAPPTPDTPTGPRLDGDLVEGDQVMVRGRWMDEPGRLATVVYVNGYDTDVRYTDDTGERVMTWRLTVTDAAGDCRTHAIARCTICAPGLVSR